MALRAGTGRDERGHIGVRPDVAKVNVPGRAGTAHRSSRRTHRFRVHFRSVAGGGRRYGGSLPPPRGPRDHGTGRLPPLLPRPPGSYQDDVERAAVSNFRTLTDVVYRARMARGWSLRTLADEAGVSLAAAGAFENGSTWPRADTLTRVLGALGLQAHIGGDADLRGALRRDLVAHRWSRREAAIAAGLRPNTVMELLAGTTAAPSTGTLLRLAAVLGSHVEVRRANPGDDQVFGSSTQMPAGEG